MKYPVYFYFFLQSFNPTNPHSYALILKNFLSMVGIVLIHLFKQMMWNKSSYLQKEKVYAYKPTLTKEIVLFPAHSGFSLSSTPFVVTYETKIY